MVNKLKCLVVLFTLLFVVASCGSAPKEKRAEIKQGASLSQPKSYSPPEIPSMLTTRDERLEFFTDHYWDNFDFADSTLLVDKSYVEHALTNFLSVLPQVSNSRASKLMTKTMQLSSVDSLALSTFIVATEKYLYNPNSPMRNEEYFIPVLEYIVNSDKVAELMKIRPKYMLKMAKKNRVRQVATDFTYTLKNGEMHSMHSIEAEYTVLFFNDPDCGDCKRVKEYIAGSQTFKKLSSGYKPRVAILSVYPEVNVLQWQEARYPSCMINSYDSGCVISHDELYDLKAMPTLYLLDAKKRTVLKDCAIEQLDAFLQGLL